VINLRQLKGLSILRTSSIQIHLLNEGAGSGQWPPHMLRGWANSYLSKLKCLLLMMLLSSCTLVAVLECQGSLSLIDIDLPFQLAGLRGSVLCIQFSHSFIEDQESAAQTCPHTDYLGTHLRNYLGISLHAQASLSQSQSHVSTVPALSKMRIYIISDTESVVNLHFLIAF